MENYENIGFSIGVVDRLAHPALRFMELSLLSSFRLSTAKSTISTASSSQLRGLDRSLSRIGLVASEERSWAALDVIREFIIESLPGDWRLGWGFWLKFEGLQTRIQGIVRLDRVKPNR